MLAPIAPHGCFLLSHQGDIACGSATRSRRGRPPQVLGRGSLADGPIATTGGCREGIRGGSSAGSEGAVLHVARVELLGLVGLYDGGEDIRRGRPRTTVSVVVCWLGRRLVAGGHRLSTRDVGHHLWGCVMANAGGGPRGCRGRGLPDREGESKGRTIDRSVYCTSWQVNLFGGVVVREDLGGRGRMVRKRRRRRRSEED